MKRKSLCLKLCKHHTSANGSLAHCLHETLIKDDLAQAFPCANVYSAIFWRIAPKQTSPKKAQADTCARHKKKFTFGSVLAAVSRKKAYNRKAKPGHFGRGRVSLYHHLPQGLRGVPFGVDDPEGAAHHQFLKFAFVRSLGFLLFHFPDFGEGELLDGEQG